VLLPFAITLTALTEVFGNGPGGVTPAGTSGVGPGGNAAAWNWLPIIPTKRLMEKMEEVVEADEPNNMLIRVEWNWNESAVSSG
jgi:hypothetical protein